jgi:lysophospholipase L1-like esterase
MLTPRKHLIAALACLCTVALSAWAAEPSVVATAEAPIAPSRWEAAFTAFAADDAAHPRPAGGVLFVGSSSIRLWNDLEEQFNDLPVVIKRGFGGSQLSDCVKHLNRLVIQYRPRTVLIYAGDNDLVAGSAPEDVFRRFTAFVDGVHRALPDTEIAYISIKPSPSRIELLPKIRETNALIRGYADAEGKVEFIDVYSPMLDGSGRPRPELFRADALHLNANGYALWKRVIAQYVH